MIGTLLNVTGILAGGIAGLIRSKPLSRAQEASFKVVLAAFIVFYGLRLTWISLNGSLYAICKQLLIVVLALILGKFAGRALRLQEFSNRLGQQARARLAAVRPEDPERAATGFKTCAALFCAAPLGILGAVQEGLSTPPYFYALGAKAVIDGLATMGFAPLFGRSVLLSAIPVLAFQGSITLLCGRFLQPLLTPHHLVDPVNAVGGLLVFCVALVMLELKKVELTAYLPSLVFAPLITWVWS